MGRAVVLGIALITASGCGSRCKDVASVRTALTSRTGAPSRGSDVQVTVPLARANALIAELLQQQPLSVPLDPPDLGPIQITTTLTAAVKDAKLLPGPPGKVRFSVTLEVADPTQQVTAIDAIAELEPELTRANGISTLAIGLGPQNVLKLVPSLGPAAKQQLGAAVSRWMPQKVKDKLPQPLVDAAASKLGGHLTGVGWQVLQKTLLVKLGDLTHVRLRLPDVPVAKVDIQSHTSPDVLVVDITTDLPVRAGLALATPPADVSVRISGSAAAELANWAIDAGHAPQWYTRSLKPSASGEFRPRFDYIGGKDHPIKVFAFQERGGCSYFKVGVDAKVELAGADLKATATDRRIEAMSANPVIEVAAWVKYFLTGAIDRSKKVAAHTQLSVGGRTLATQVTSAELARDELAIGLAFSAPTQPSAVPTSSRALRSSAVVVGP